jgi:hypothetical protein
MTSKVIRSIGSTVLAMACALAVPAAAAAQTPQTPASLAGTWNMSLIGDHVIPVALILEQNGTALKGTFVLMGKDFPLTGNVVDGKVTLTGKGPAFGRKGAGPNGDHNTAVAAGAHAALADMTISGLVGDDGNLAGSIAMKFGEETGAIKWSAERLKERALPASQAVSAEGVNLSGGWIMTIPEAQQVLDMELKQDGAKVTGTAKNDHLGTLTLDGMFANGTLSFVASGSAGGQDVKLEFSGKYIKGGTFAGDATSSMGPLTWTAERVKR